jgi:hypothetical protein
VAKYFGGRFKTKNMIPQINYEILLFTATNFLKKRFCGKVNCHQPDNFSEQLQEACWNGLVFEILPDIIEHSSAKMTPYVWEILPAKNFY